MSSNLILRKIKTLIKESSWEDNVFDLEVMFAKEEELKNSQNNSELENLYKQYEKKLSNFEKELPKVVRLTEALTKYVESLTDELSHDEKNVALKTEIKEVKQKLKSAMSRKNYLQYIIPAIKSKLAPKDDAGTDTSTSDIYAAFDDIEGKDQSLGDGSEKTANVPPLRKYGSNAYKSTQSQLGIISDTVDDILQSKSLNFYRKYLYLYYVRHYLNVYKVVRKNANDKLVISAPNQESYSLNRGKYYALVDKFIFSSGQEPSIRELRTLLSSVSYGITYSVVSKSGETKKAIPRHGFSFKERIKKAKQEIKNQFELEMNKPGFDANIRADYEILSGNPEEQEKIYLRWYESQEDIGKSFSQFLQDKPSEDDIKAIDYVEEAIEIAVSIREEETQSMSDDLVDSGLDKMTTNQEKIEIKKSLSDNTITEYDRETIEMLDSESEGLQREYEIEVAYINSNTPEIFGGTVDYRDTEAIQNDLPNSNQDILDRVELIKNNILNCLRFFEFNILEDGSKNYYIENKNSYSEVEGFLKEAYKSFIPFLKINASDDDEIFEEFTRENEEKEYKKRKVSYNKESVFYPVFVFLKTCLLRFTELKRLNDTKDILDKENKLYTLLYYFVREPSVQDLEKVAKGSKFTFNLGYIENIYKSRLVDIDPIVIYSMKDQISEPWRLIKEKYKSVLNLGVEIEEVVELQDFIESLNRPIKLKELYPYYPDISSESGIRQHLLKVADLDKWAKSDLNVIAEIYYRAIKIYENFLKTQFDEDVFEFDNPFSDSEREVLVDSYGNPISGDSSQIFDLVTIENLRLYFEDVINRENFIESIQPDAESNCPEDAANIIHNFVINDNSLVRKFVSHNLFEYYVGEVYNPFYYEVYTSLCRYFQNNFSQTEIGLSIEDFSHPKQWQSEFDSSGVYGKNFLHTLANLFSNRSDIKEDYDFYPELNIDFEKEKLKKIKKVLSGGLKKLIKLNVKLEEPDEKIQFLNVLLSQSDSVSEDLFDEFRDKNSDLHQARKNHLTVNENTPDDFFNWIRNEKLDVRQNTSSQQETKVIEDDDIITRLKEYEFNYEQYLEILSKKPDDARVFIEDTIEFFEEEIDDLEEVRAEYEFLKAVRDRDNNLYSGNKAEFNYSGFDFEIIKHMIMNAVDRLSSNNLTEESFEQVEDSDEITGQENSELNSVSSKELYRYYKMHCGVLDIEDFDGPEDFAKFNEEIQNLRTVNIQKMSSAVKSNLVKYIRSIIDEGRKALKESK